MVDAALVLPVTPPFDPGGPTMAEGEAPKEDNGTLLLLDTPPERPPGGTETLPAPLEGFPGIITFGTEPPPGCFGVILISSSNKLIQ